MNKKGVVILLLVLCIGNVFALGVSPGKKTFNFDGAYLEETIDYGVRVDTDKPIVVRVEGDLAEYITLSRTELVDERFFSATLRLPANFSTPGQNRAFVVVSEQVDPERADFISTTVTIKSIIDVYVPYPGRYLELEIEGVDVNVGEPIEFLLDVVSRGDEGVSITPEIQIYSETGKVETLYLTSRIIASQEEMKLKKTLDTAGYNPGNYKAVAAIDYGVLAEAETDFRIGNLSIAILNYTRDLEVGGLVPFKVIIQSGWNDIIDGAYADVTILNNSLEVASFKTTTTSLSPWEEKEIVGYFDATNFSEGNYSAQIDVYYFGRSAGSSTSTTVDIVFIAQSILSYWYYVLIGGIILFVVSGIARLILIKLYKKKHGKKKRK